MKKLDLLTISQTAQAYDVTPRMLRHYEKLGLISPHYIEDYAYRCYDENAIKRLRIIILLRKLRMPLKQIAVILNDGKCSETIAILQDNLKELNSQINSLETVRNILNDFLTRLKDGISGVNVSIDLLNDNELLDAVNSISISKKALRETSQSANAPQANSYSSLQTEYNVIDSELNTPQDDENETDNKESYMSELNSANENINKNLNVRIIQLPPFTVASNRIISKEPEATVGVLINKFIKESRLYEIKPDSRYFGFNHPNPGILPDGDYGYEVWVTIPDDMEIPSPLEKKHFDGGLFAALAMPFPEFSLWQDLFDWVNQSELFDVDFRGNEEIMGGALEEHLNFVYAAHMDLTDDSLTKQLDLLFPIKKKNSDK